MTNGDQSAITSASTKEEVLKRIKEEDLDIPPEAPLLPKSNLKVQKYLQRALDNPDQYELYKLNKVEGTTKGLRKAVRNNNISLQNYFTGRQDWDADLSGIQSLKRFFNIISSPGGRLIYLFGSQGSGKTDFATLSAEFLHDILGVEIGTNIKSLAEDQEHVVYIDTYEDLKDWLTTEGRKFFILDEASSLLTGYYSDSGDVIDAFKDFITKLRKNDSNICLIGHSGKDIHPLFRRLAIFAHKESKKRLNIYRSANVDNNGKVEGIDNLVQLNEIPPSNWNYDTDEESVFRIDGESEAQYSSEEVEEMIDQRLEEELKEQRNNLIRQVYEVSDDISYSDLANVFELSKQRVSTIVNS